MLIPVEFEKKPVLLRPIVADAPAFSVVIHADPAPSILVLKILHTDIFVPTPRVLVLILPLFEKKPVLLIPDVNPLVTPVNPEPSPTNFA